jgi:hypothetical protein
MASIIYLFSDSSSHCHHLSRYVLLLVCFLYIVTKPLYYLWWRLNCHNLSFHMSTAELTTTQALRNHDVFGYFVALQHQAPEFVFGSSCAGVLTIYLKVFAPWRHRNWPYNESQLRLRSTLGSPLPPLSGGPVRIFVPIVILSAVYGRVKRLFKNKINSYFQQM